MLKNIHVVLITGLIYSQTSFAQNFDKERLDNYFNRLDSNNKFMGSVAVSQNGKIIYTKVVGFSDVENKVKAHENTKYRIGSISKTFTSVLVMKAVEENRLTLNQTILSFFPTITGAEKITVKQLLTHRSGIHNFTDDEDYLSWSTQHKTEEEMVRIIAEAGSDFEPGTKAAYSNSNFVLLTFILEKTFGKSYSKLLKEYITTPLGLKNTGMGAKIDINDNACYSYRMNNSWEKVSETDISIPLGAGGIISTPSDLVRFSDALFGGKLLGKESLLLMETIEDGFGIGMFQIPFYDKAGFGHNGGIDGFSSVFCFFEDGNVSYALTSNGTDFNVNNISIAVLSAVFNKPFDIPQFSTYTVSPEDLNLYPGIYASEQIPLKITVRIENQSLVAQATGQASFPLEATAKNVFTFEQAGIVMEFNPLQGTMTLKQGGGEFLFTKE